MAFQSGCTDFHDLQSRTCFLIPALLCSRKLFASIFHLVPFCNMFTSFLGQSKLPLAQYPDVIGSCPNFYHRLLITAQRWYLKDQTDANDVQLCPGRTPSARPSNLVHVSAALVRPVACLFSSAACSGSFSPPIVDFAHLHHIPFSQHLALKCHVQAIRTLTHLVSDLPIQFFSRFS